VFRFVPWEKKIMFHEASALKSARMLVLNTSFSVVKSALPGTPE
jgi:hypothetical protein